MSEAATIATCPNCNTEGASLLRIEPGMKLRLQEHGALNPVPAEVCDSCMRQLAKMVSSGALLRAEKKNKDDNRLTLWRNRVNLIKQAKQLMQSKVYSDAAVAYEKYLRILEVVYERSPGALSPELFSSEARKQEITVIASVYWDLMRIYDVSDKYKDRQMKAAEKLADFVRYTKVFSDIVRRAEAQAKSAKNPAAFKHFLKLVNKKRGRCFIATAAFDGRTPEVTALCLFRDEILRVHPLGRRIIWLYYKVSPPIAVFLDANPRFKPPVRKTLALVAERVGRISLNHRRRS